jgi:hypothetical protein
MRSFFVGAGVLVLVACTNADPYGDMPKGPDARQDTAQAAATCAAGGGGGDLAGADPTTLKECKGTKAKGRCVPGAALGSFKGTFEQATCEGDAECVPDEVVKAGSKVQLKKCTGILGSEGRCFWPLAKAAVENYDLLKPSSKDCPDDMVCAPCINPLDKKPTGVCELGGGGGGGACSNAAGKQQPASASAPAAATCPQVDPIIDTKAFPQDVCSSNMLCVPASATGDLAKLLKDCKDGGKCAPTKMVARAGNYVPKTCRSLADAEGRCLNVGIPDVAAQSTLLPRADCDPDELCTPCFDPRTGADTGACHAAPCDAPKEPKKTLAQCCGGRGQCVPPSLAADSASLLAKETCSGDALCAPNELVGSATPKKCSAGFGLVSGICVSKCAIDTLAASFLQGDCADGDMCAPCIALPAGSCK